MTVTIITFDGTAAENATNFEISESLNPDPALALKQRNLGGGFPQNVARRLLAYDPVTWRWLPMDYKPGFRIFNPLKPNDTYDVPLKNGSVGRALALLGGKLPQVPGKIVLCGLSQGAIVADLAFEEFRNPAGLFHSRNDDLLAVVTFGSPRRPAGRSTQLAGAIHGTGKGAFDFNIETSFGTVPGLMESPPDNVWQFNMIGDAASDVAADDDGIKEAAEFLWDGDLESGLGLIGQLGNVVIDAFGVLGEAIWSAIKPGGTSQRALSQWLPFLSGAFGAEDPRVDNPHAQYNSYAYTGVTGNTSGGTAVYGTPGAKTAVDYAVEYLTALGAQYAGVDDIPRTTTLGYTWWQTPPDAA